MKIKFFPLLASAALIITLTINSNAQCYMSQVISTSYGADDCNGKNMQFVTGAIAPINGSCGNYFFTPPITDPGNNTISRHRVDLAVVSIYPNPTRDWVYIDNLSENENYKVYVVNAFGVVLLEENSGSNNTRLILNTSSLSPGIYFIKVTAADHLFITQKLIKI